MRWTPLLALMAIQSIPAPPCAGATPCATYEPRSVSLGQLPFTADCVELVKNGTTIYVAAQNPAAADEGLQIIDVTDPSQPLLVESVLTPPEGPLPFRPEAVELAAGAVFVGGQVVSTTSPKIAAFSPNGNTLLSQTTLTGSLANLTADGDLLFAAVRGGGLYVLDVADPTSVSVLSQYVPADGAFVEDVVVSGSYAYLARSDTSAAGLGGIEVLDVFDPTSPVSVGVCFGSAPSSRFSVALSGTDVFALYTPGPLDYDNDRFVARYDVGDPAQPVEAKVIVTYEAGERLRMSGGLLLLPSVVPGFPSSGWGNVTVFDPSDFDSGPIGAHFARGGFDAIYEPPVLYTGGANSAGLNTAEIVVPETVIPVARSYVGTTALPLEVRDLEILGTTGVQCEYYGVASGEGLRLFDFSVPGAITTQSLWSQFTATYRRMDAEGVRAVVASDQGLEAFNIGGGIGRRGLATITGAEDVVLSGSTAYVASSAQELVVVDIGPVTPAVVATVPTASANMEMESGGGYLFVRDDADGIHVFDLADPLLPAFSGSVTIPETIDGIHVAFPRVYAKSAVSGMVYVVDASVPSSPVVTGSVQATAGLARMASGPGPDLLYALWNDVPGSFHSGFEVIDATDPAAPVVLESQHSPFNPNAYDTQAVTVANGMVVLSSQGLVICYPLQCAVGSAVAALPAVEPDATPGTIRGAPNPFTTGTDLRLSVAASGRATVGIYDVRGRVVRHLRTGRLEPGPLSLRWDGADDGGRLVAPGVYFVRLQGEAGVARGRVTRIR